MVSKILAATGGLLLAAIASLPGRAQVPGPPVLLNPAEGTTIRAPSNQVPTQIFTWRAPAAGAAPEAYRFRLQDAGDPAGFSSTSDVATGQAATTSTIQIIPPPLRGRTIRWSVASCTGAGAGRTCGAPAARTLRWAAGLEPPRHLRPLDAAIGPDTGVTPRFEWTAVAGANSYLFCAVLSPDSVCQLEPVSSPTIEVVRRLGGGNTFAAPDLSRWMGRRIYWTAAACDERNLCVWNDGFRAFTLLNKPRLINPAADDLILPPDYRVVFTWSVVPGASAYVLVIARSGEGFDVPAEQFALFGNQRNNTAWNVPDGLRQTSGGRLKWTVAACIGNVLTGAQVQCNVQQDFRWFQLALERGPLRYEVLNGFHDQYVYLYASDEYISRNDPVPGANVCLGTRANPTRYGTATTGSDGVALFPFVPAGSYVVTATASGVSWPCKPRYVGVGYVFCAPPARDSLVNGEFEVSGEGLIGGINEPARIRLRLDRDGPGPCPAPPDGAGNIGISIDVDRAD